MWWRQSCTLTTLMGLLLGSQRAGFRPHSHPKETLVAPRVSEAAGGQRAHRVIEQIYKFCTHIYNKVARFRV